jgi:hypothetical protein
VDGGFDPDSFWRQTPRRLDIVLKSIVNRRAREHDHRAWLAWHTALLPHLTPFPPLSDLLSTSVQEQRAQTVEEQISIAMAWSAAVQSQPQA